MEEAISKFMDGMEAQERGGFKALGLDVQPMLDHRL
jgi:hypothetical protein